MGKHTKKINNRHPTEKKIGPKGNETVKEGYSVRANSNKYLNLFKS
jgi:hypothetical protein